MPNGKLVRDRIPALIIADGGTPRATVLDEPAYTAALKAKLLEEAEEVFTADEGSLLEEIADVYEVLLALAATRGADLANVQRVAQEKVQARGGFTSRIWLQSDWMFDRRRPDSAAQIHMRHPAWSRMLALHLHTHLEPD